MTRIHHCRISDSTNLVSVLNLGDQAFTGTFPSSPTQHVPTGPLELLWCPDSGLLQMANQFDLTAMYGSNYGYRSSLNRSMVTHLQSKAKNLERRLN